MADEKQISTTAKAVAGLGAGGMATALIFLVNQLVGLQRDVQHMEDLHNQHTPRMDQIQSDIRSINGRIDELYHRMIEDK